MAMWLVGSTNPAAVAVSAVYDRQQLQWYFVGASGVEADRVYVPTVVIFMPLAMAYVSHRSSHNVVPHRSSGAGEVRIAVVQVGADYLSPWCGLAFLVRPLVRPLVRSQARRRR
jgi:hypothetical protein